MDEKYLDEKFKNLNDKIENSNDMISVLFSKFDKFIEKHDEKHDKDDLKCDIHTKDIHRIDKEVSTLKVFSWIISISIIALITNAIKSIFAN